MAANRTNQPGSRDVLDGWASITVETVSAPSVRFGAPRQGSVAAELRCPSRDPHFRAVRHEAWWSDGDERGLDEGNVNNLTLLPHGPITTPFHRGEANFG
jgi:hypothetical protein